MEPQGALDDAGRHLPDLVRAEVTVAHTPIGFLPRRLRASRASMAASRSRAWTGFIR
jgi:hypothetical protein